jgi:RHH-type proline utilization regulon transcriptional repressor/proline dehydrogenase/delta 1-pyrroline-5-carboxylate dehydrogenase
VLQAYQPDALAAMMELQDWAAARVEAGGARIKVRLVKGANLAMERVDAEIHDWPLTTWPSKHETDTHYKRVMDWAMTPERTRTIRLGIAGQNIFDIAFAWILAGRRGVRDDVEIEMLSGMATGLAEVVRREVGHLLLYIPVVDPKEFDVAIAYLVRRLEENSAPENFMSGVFDIRAGPLRLRAEAERFSPPCSPSTPTIPSPRRCGPRTAATRRRRRSPRRPGRGRGVDVPNTPDTGPVAARQPGVGAGDRGTRPRVGARDRGGGRRRRRERRGDRRHHGRGRRGGGGMGGTARRRARRDHSTAWRGARAAAGRVAGGRAAEAGKTLDQGDPRFRGHRLLPLVRRARPRLEQVEGARFVPSRVTLVTPPWNFPLAIPRRGGGGARGGQRRRLQGGDAGAQVRSPPRRGDVGGGCPARAAAVVQTPTGRWAEPRLTPRVDRVILTGSYDTASCSAPGGRSCRCWRRRAGRTRSS